MDHFQYKHIIKENMVLYAFTPFYQQDNGPKHCSKYWRAWLGKKMTNSLEWPPQSPNLNSIENLCKILDMKI